MSIFRQYIAPMLIVLIFLIALLAVSVRIFLPTDMAAPAPIASANSNTADASLSPALSMLVNGSVDHPL